ncbi:MAG TPA: hypothetical protein VIN08_09570 [Ohtaekwangia sp.]|uniref:hypothetical protein n=1 Tax=Ohtaekwangia sp. TaxID=2066019 RepID=UPI002F937245
MKTLTLRCLSAGMLFLTATLLASCNLFDKADDVAFNTTLDHDIEASESTSGTNVTYQQVITLDATSDSEISRYKDKIKGFEVNKIKYTISSYSGAFATKFTGKFGFGDESGTSYTVSTTITDLDLQAAYTAGTVYELTLPVTEVAKIEAMLRDKKEVKIYVDGTLSQTPVAFTISVSLDVSIQADAL